MNEQTVLSFYKSRAQAVGGDAWVEEILIRGDANGIRGAHLVVGWSAPGVDGLTVSNVSQALPLTMETDDPLWEQVKTDLSSTTAVRVLALQETVNAQSQQMGELQTAKDAADQQIIALQAQIVALQAELANIEYVE